MRHTFKTIALMGKQKKPDVIATLKKLVVYFTDKKIKLILEEQTAQLLSNNLPYFSLDCLGKHADLLIVVGGDGSLLGASRSASKQNLPILGVNCGKLGFLNDVYPDKIAKIEDILQGNFYEEQRFLLQTQVTKKNKTVWQDIALNDTVLLAGTAGHMISFSVSVDEKFVCNYRADGLIVATPTGSTAHALAGGGPILYPELDAMVLVPMFSHNLSSRPIVIQAESQVKIDLDKNNTEPARISCDGQMYVATTAGSTVHIGKAREKLRLIHPLDYNYFEALRTKLHWEN